MKKLFLSIWNALMFTDMTCGPCNLSISSPQFTMHTCSRRYTKGLGIFLH